MTSVVLKTTEGSRVKGTGETKADLEVRTEEKGTAANLLTVFHKLLDEKYE